MKNIADWTQQFPGLSRLPDHVRQILLKDGQIIQAKQRQQVFGPGHVPENLLFLLSGTVRVSQISEGGREIVLYRVEAGQSCVMTTACMLAYEAYLAEGIAETDVRAVALPKATFDKLVSVEPIFRDFILAAYAHRLTGLFKIIEDVAFGRIDVRLAARILDLAGTTSEVSATHQALATELGTAREVVSRQLHEFQRRGWLEQQRGLVRIVDRAALSELAGA